MRLPALIACVATVATAACSDSTAPSRAVGHYELVAVNGNPMPLLPSVTVHAITPLYLGDLVLRADGTYGLAIGFFTEGTWTLDGTRLNLGQSRLQGSSPPEAAFDGDSIVIDIAGSGSQAAIGYLPPMHYLFRRSAATPSVVTSGSFVLTTVNGRGEPFILSDTTISGVRSVDQVLFDSVTFRDGVFFREHRAENYTGLYGASSASEFIANGSYRGRPDSLLLSLNGSYPTTDRLAVEQQQLVRRRQFTTGTVEERYTRH